MTISQIKEYIMEVEEVTIPQVQAAFTLKYSEVRKVFYKLEGEKFIRLKDDLTYVLCQKLSNANDKKSNVKDKTSTIFNDEKFARFNEFFKMFENRDRIFDILKQARQKRESECSSDANREWLNRRRNAVKAYNKLLGISDLADETQLEQDVASEIVSIVSKEEITTRKKAIQFAQMNLSLANAAKNKKQMIIFSVVVEELDAASNAEFNTLKKQNPPS